MLVASVLDTIPARSRTALPRVILSITSVKLSLGPLSALSNWYASSEMAMFFVPMVGLCVYVWAAIYVLLHLEEQGPQKLRDLAEYLSCFLVGEMLSHLLVGFGVDHGPYRLRPALIDA